MARVIIKTKVNNVSPGDIIVDEHKNHAIVYDVTREGIFAIYLGTGDACVIKDMSSVSRMQGTIELSNY